MPNGIPANVAQAGADADAALEAAAAEQRQDQQQRESAVATETPAPTPAASSTVRDDAARSADVEVLRQENASLREQVAHERQLAASAVGRMSTEGPRNAERIREMGEAIQRLQDEVKRANTGGTPGDPSGWQANLTEDEIQEYKTAKEALGVSGRAILGVMERQNQELRATLNTLQKDIRGDSVKQAAKTRDEQVWNAVERIQPGALEANFNDPEFPVWLQGAEPNSGLPWAEIAQRAFNKGDVGRLATIVKRYLVVKGRASDSPSNETTAPRVRPDRLHGRPGPINDTGAPGPHGPVHKMSVIQQFYTDITKQGPNADAKTLEDRKRMEIEYDKAVAEGRVDYDA